MRLGRATGYLGNKSSQEEPMEAPALLRDSNRTVPMSACLRLPKRERERTKQSKRETERSTRRKREEARERDNLCHADGGCGSETQRKVWLEIASKQESYQGRTFKHRPLLCADATPPLYNARHSLSSGFHTVCLKPYLDDVKFGVTNVATVVHFLA